MKKHHLQSPLAFRLMSIEFALRDRLRPPDGILDKIGVRPGMTVLDFGCGPGGFSLAASGKVGSNGRVFAVDIHPQALEILSKRIEKKRILNICTILGDTAGIPDETFDIILLYDVLHELEEPGAILKELFRLSKPKGRLSVSDHHMKYEEIISVIASSGFFHPKERFPRTIEFERVDREGRIS